MWSQPANLVKPSANDSGDEQEIFLNAAYSEDSIEHAE
jgi:hypothetical protein